MKPNESSTSTEQRRKLLKSALAASSVVGVGYSGAVAASSLAQCIVHETAPVLFAQFTGQISTVEASPYVWKQVTVNKSGNDFSFSLDGINYSLNATQLATMPNGNYPKPAWVLAYFSADVDRTIQYDGAYPAKTKPGTDGTPAVAYAQASVGCAGSLGVTTTGNKKNIYSSG